VEASRHTPNDPSLWNDLGMAYLLTLRLPEAIQSLQRSTVLRPSFADTHFNLGLALEQSGDREAALVAHRRAIALSPRLAEAHARVAEILLQRGSSEGAVAAYEQAGAAAPGTNLGDLAIAKARLVVGRSGDAEERLARLLARDPSCAEGHVLLGVVLSEAGRFAEAGVSFERALALAPANATAHHGLVSTRRLTARDRPMVDRILSLLRVGSLPEPVATTLHFAAGKGLDDLGDTAGAIEHFDAANRGRRRLARPFDARDFEARVGRLIERYTPELFAAHAPLGSEDETPILVLGMPRSGTTLVERTLASHPKVRGGGELVFWNTRAPSLVEAAPQALGDAASAVQRDYLGVLRGVGEAARVTDKMPFNFLWVGLFHLLFPRARVVHCRRHPVDTCLSIYTTLFAQHWGFASDRGDLASYYRQYARLMDHWRAVLPEGRLLDVDYEAVVSDPEGSARRLVAFAGLAWDDACLHPESSAEVVRTASKWQARQPIFRTSVERWRRYEPWLGELSGLMPDAGRA
jgi:Flp pilus assembly protein TadD